MGFIRRFSAFPGVDVITQIEGVDIIDLTPPGPITGVGTGVACVVGEFADMTYGVAISSAGVVSTAPQAVEIFSSADLLGKVGGFDETIGEFGVSMGNGFVEVRNKKYSRLIVVPVNLASSRGVRVFRDLPTNRGATDPTSIVPVQAAAVLAGREFKSGSNRVRIGRQVNFSNALAYASGTDGAQASNAGPAATGVFTSAGSTFQTAGAQKGDILVLGVIGGSGLPGTYRIVSVDSQTQITVERMDGASFTWASISSLPFRLHPAATADSVGPGFDAADAGGYTVPARPLDATITSGTVLTPTIIPSAGTATSWDTLSGLGARANGDGTGLIYTSAVQAPNAVSASAIDTLYGTAIDVLLNDAAPQNDVDLVWAARKSSTIASKLKAHADAQSAQGRGRIAAISPPLTTLTVTAAIAATYPGVGGNRDERVAYNWVGALTQIPEAVGFALKGADGVLYSDGKVDTTFDSWAVSVMSQIQPERNPGELSKTVANALQAILGYQRAAPNLGISEFMTLRAQGIMGLRIDRAFGPCIQSGITTSLKTGEKNMNRRRFADFIEDSLADALIEFNKLPVDANFIDGVMGEATAFMENLLAPNNPPASRIRGYTLDDKSGNTPDMEDLGIFVITVGVKMKITADFIVLPVSVGPGVEVST
jgi:hypothetical protein